MQKKSIAIYKPYKIVHFHEDRTDLSSVFYEVVNVAKIFAERGCQVTLLSETDLDENLPITNIQQGRLEDSEHFDRVFLFSGSFAKDNLGEAVIPLLRQMTFRLDFILTDLRLTPSREMWRFFDKVYTQATRPLVIIPNSIPQQYGKVAEFLPFQHEFRDLSETVKEKDIEFYFGGTFRDRERAMLEYVIRPGHIVTTKDDKRQIDTRVDRNEYRNLLRRAKFSITIADESYNRVGFITPRFFENIMFDIIGFVEKEFDVDEHLLSHTHYLRVSNYNEMRKKMDEINLDYNLYLKLLQEQRSRIIQTIINGDDVYQALNGDKYV